MMWREICKIWNAVPMGLKRTIGFAAGAIAFLTELILEAKDAPAEDSEITKERDLYREQL